MHAEFGRKTGLTIGAEKHRIFTITSKAVTKTAKDVPPTESLRMVKAGGCTRKLIPSELRRQTPHGQVVFSVIAA
jgi:hypothetical protein